jgi:cytosine/adenosine deaminase-related metal-dependent hydrolase
MDVMIKTRKITSDQIFTNTSVPLEDAVLILDSQGTILGIESLVDHDPVTVKRYDGIIVPGFVNAHCHLELSHMLGKADTGTGLIPFLKNVVNFRDIEEEVIKTAITQADQEMYTNGIVAVGDISNKTDTFFTKSKSQIRYYTFVEMFDFMQDELVDQFFSRYKKVFDQAPQACSVVPHAPYTVSRALFERINRLNQGIKSVSIHNQETSAENLLFEKKQGPFLSFYEAFGFSLDKFIPIGKTSIHYALSALDKKHKYLFVHNTTSNLADIRTAQGWSDQIYWVTCPNANLYIENKLPDYSLFINEDAKVCIGTDSLTSNWQLSIFEEMKTIAKYQSFIPTESLIRWATLNGAKALGFDDTLGSIQIGKRPGLNLITLNHQGKLDKTSTHKRLS